MYLIIRLTCLKNYICSLDEAGRISLKIKDCYKERKKYMSTSRGGRKGKIGVKECQREMPSDSLGIFVRFYSPEKKNNDCFTIRFARR